MAKILFDARTGLRGEEILSAIAAPSLQPKVREYLSTEADAHTKLQSERHYDLSVGGFYRSSMEGPGEAPTRVNFEIAAVADSRVLNVRKFYATRYDVTWVDGSGWRLTDFSDGSFADVTGDVLPPAEKKRFLKGRGWRSFEG